MTTIATPVASCSALSRQAGEPLEGSATLTDTYLLLEYSDAWGEKALEDSNLPAEVKAHLKAYQKSHSQAKVLLIRRPGQKSGQGIHFFIASTAPGREALYEYRLVMYADLLDMDFDSILASQPADCCRNEPLFLVCTNGRRDQCCARFGQEVFKALNDATTGLSKPQVWECSHVGGHRFAANLLMLPTGLLYGRVDPASAIEILAAARKGEPYLPNLRGRTSFPPGAQAAEIFLRRQLAEQPATSDQALILLDLREIPPLGWQVEFLSETSGELYRLMVGVKHIPDQVFDGCSLDKRTALVRYYRI